MDEQTGDPPRTRIEVFVRTPDGKIDPPIVQRHRYVSNSVSEIPAADASLNERINSTVAWAEV